MQRLMLGMQIVKPLKSNFNPKRFSSQVVESFGRFGRNYIIQRRNAQRMDKIYKTIGIYVCVPALIYSFYRAMLSHHAEEERGRPEYIPYEYRSIRNRPFPWGDGNHPLFFNPKFDWVPGVGYEKDH